MISGEKIRTLRELDSCIPAESDVCVFWVDDGQPIGEDFLRRMVQPLVESGPSRASMHLWSGHALALPRTAVRARGDAGFVMTASPPMKLPLMLLDVNTARPGFPTHVAFS